MIKRALLVTTLLLALNTTGVLAQEVTERLPDFSARTVRGESVVDLADFLSGYLAESGMIPDMVQVRIANDRLTTLTAAEAFTLLARTAYLWRTTGALPETVPITPDQVSPPALDTEDLVPPATDPEVGRNISTEPFLAQVAAVVQWVDRLQVIPTAVWVDGKRLSAAEYLAGLTIATSYAYWEGQLQDMLFLPKYAPPRTWSGGVVHQEEAWRYEDEYEDYEWWDAEDWEEGPETTLGDIEYSAEDYYAEAYGWEEEDGFFWGEDWSQLPTAPLGVLDPQHRERKEPQARENAEEMTGSLLVLPEPGETISGMVDILAVYSGPPASFVVFTINEGNEIIRNFAPYNYRWDTQGLKPGMHTVRVTVLGEGDRILADQVTVYFVAEEKATEGESE